MLEMGRTLKSECVCVGGLMRRGRKRLRRGITQDCEFETYKSPVPMMFAAEGSGEFQNRLIQIDHRL